MKNLTVVSISALLWLCTGCTPADDQSKVQEITYTNPILHLDYSDPDVVQVGQKYYMTASSFNCIPGLPLLESENLVDWKLIGYAIERLEPDSVYSKPQHGNGVWAPSIRYHNNQFYIYYGDPDFGLFVVTAPDIKGPWSKPQLVKAGKGWIDPCPFWDDNGEAWLVHAWAGSRAGIKSTLTLHKMSPDGMSLRDNGIIIFDGHQGHTTVEGPKMYKRNGYYYVLAPAGGVTQGWQIALRAIRPDGPYEMKVVLHQGNSPINGPHQGGWVDNIDGTSWFIHFQDKDAYGRIVHLQPVNWLNDWPVMGTDADGDGCGEPVLQASIKSVKPKAVADTTLYTDEFNEPALNLHWQWHANPMAQWGAPTARLGYLRLNAVPFLEAKNGWDWPNLLMQKFPSERFTAITKLDLFLKNPNDMAGLMVMGYDYAYLAIEHTLTGNQLVYRVCHDADKGGTDQTIAALPWEPNTVYLKTVVSDSANCTFMFSADGTNFIPLPQTFKALPGKWIGAKTGLFCNGKTTTNDAGYVNADWFRISTLTN